MQCVCWSVQPFPVCCYVPYQQASLTRNPKLFLQATYSLPHATHVHAHWTSHEYHPSTLDKGCPCFIQLAGCPATAHTATHSLDHQCLKLRYVFHEHLTLFAHCLDTHFKQGAVPCAQRLAWRKAPCTDISSHAACMHNSTCLEALACLELFCMRPCQDCSCVMCLLAMQAPLR